MSQLINIERTFLMIKPDGVKRGLIGDIYSRLERMGMKLVAARMIHATEEQARKNYPGTEEWLNNLGEKTYVNYNNDLERIKEDLGTIDKLEIGNKIYDGLVKYLTNGPVVISVWEGNHAVQVVRKLAGKTDPTLADIGSIRGDFGFDTPQFAVKSGRVVFRTIVHISDSQDEAKREIKHWFGKDFKYLGDYDRMDYTGMYETWE
jgi:nucleoside-diphosphate kinase